MICPNCRKAAKLWKESSTPGVLYQVDQLHGPHSCPGGSYCDCQHHVLPKSISP